MNYTLGLCHVEERYTVNNLKASIEKVLDDWALDKAFAIVTDNGSNIVAAANICDRILNSVHCFGHTSQLIVNTALSSVSAVADMLKLVRDVSRYFRRSGPS